MRLVALTGGIGSGKSSVSAGLGHHGARLIDADAIVAELQRPDQPVFVAMVKRWGQDIVTTEGELNRPAVAKIVFNDSEELDALNKIVHPEVGKEMQRRIEEASESTDVVILDIPLLAEGMNNRGASATIVVDCPVPTAIERLIEHRNFDAADAHARVDAQAKRHVRLTLADWVVNNAGSLEALEEEIDKCWNWLQSLPQTKWEPKAPQDETETASVTSRQADEADESKAASVAGKRQGLPH
jgi:dephospho-CoA kinase